MIKSLVFKLLSSFADPTKAYREAERELLVERKKNINLKGSEAERLKATKEWSKPENIAARMKWFEENPAIKPEPLCEQPEIPDPLPEEFIGQQPSFIRMILRHRKEDNDKMSILTEMSDTELGEL